MTSDDVVIWVSGAAIAMEVITAIAIYLIYRSTFKG